MSHAMRLLLIVFFYVFTNNVSAQTGAFYNTSHKLSSSFVREVFQDKQGFIWAATNNGLNRYDGYHFYSYGEKDGLANNHVNAITQTQDNVLLVGTARGLSLRINDAFSTACDAENGEPQKMYVNCFGKLHDGTPIICTSGAGLWILNKHHKLERIYGNIAETSFCHVALQSADGTLWVITPNDGILAIKTLGNISKIVERHNPAPASSDAYLCEDYQGNLYASFLNDGVYRYDRATHSFVGYPATKGCNVATMLVDGKDQILLGTDGGGMKLLNTATGIVSNASPHSPHLNMDQSKVYSLIRDTHGNLWMGLMQKGLFCQPVVQSPFKYIGYKEDGQLSDACIMGLFRQSNGTLWVMSDQDGLYALTADGALKRHYAPGNGTGLPGTILSMCEDYEGRLWVASYTDGCGWFDEATGEYHRLDITQGQAHSVFDLKADKKGNLWIGTMGDGLKCHNLKTGQTKHYRAQDGGNNRLQNNYIIEMIYCEKQEVLFVGTAVGLNCLDIKKQSWTSTLGEGTVLEGEQINSMAYSKKHGLWVGTQNGLWLIDNKTRKPKKIDALMGCTAKAVASIEIDSQDRLWLGTSAGMGCYTPKTHQYLEYYTGDGLQGDEFSDGVSLRAPDGRMYFGGVQGITYFKPENIRPSSTRVDVVLADIMAGNETVSGGKLSGRYEICDSMVALSDRFEFSHRDNTLTLRFSTLSFIGADHVTYSYSINNAQWITLPAGQSELRLAQMQPGDYHFKVMAIDNGVKSAVKEFDIVIHNPWYFTPLARIIYLFLIIGAVCLYVLDLKARNRQRLRLQAHMHSEQLNEQKLQFFINMSHEIRTPMTLIVSPLLQLIKEDTDPHRRATYDVIRRNAERIMNLVNQIMDLRKLDKGLMKMQMVETDAVSFTSDVVDMFRQQAEGRSISLNFSKDTVSLPVYLDRSAFDKVLLNLMSNAFKYTPNGGRIDVSVAEVKGAMELTVTNTGEHIAPEDLQRIFQRFYQSPTKVNQNKVGTGVGLDLTRSLVELHHGHIEAENTSNGVRFKVYMPLGTEHLTEAEMASWQEGDGGDEGIGGNESGASALSQALLTSAEAEEDGESVADMLKAGRQKRVTIAIVDDDDEIRSYLTQKLSATYRTISFSDGAEALPAILREQPNLIITDVMMPGMDGITLCAKLKANVNCNHIPIIMLTAKTRDEDEMEGLETGADLYVTKPFNIDILMRQVQNLLSSRRVMENKFTGKEDMKELVDDVQMESVDDRLLSRIMDVINKNLGNSDLNINMICTEVGISRVHLHRRMKELTNQTPHDFIRNLRLKQAARLLGEGGHSVTEVMYRCGFNSATSFSTMFKKMYGMSPRDYMKAQLDEQEED